jgi:branched-chain amino acid transport system substrate-binding protein
MELGLHKMKVKGLMTLIMVFMLILAGCSSGGATADSGKGENEDTIRVGLQAPMTGDNAQYGQDMKNGVDLAFKKINAEGGVNGKQLELIVGDDKAMPSEAVAVVNKMVINDNVKAIIGGYNSSPTLAAQEVSKGAKALHLHMGASPEFTTLDNDYLFRIILTGQVYVPAVMNYMAKEKGVKKIASLYENTDYGITMSDAATKAAKEAGVEFIAKETYNPGDKNFSSQLSKIKKLKPDAVMIVGLYNEVALIAQQAKQAGLDVQFFSPDDSMYSDQLIVLGGDAVEGHIFASMLDLEMETDELKEFKKLAEENDIAVEANTAIAYDAGMAVAKAFQDGGDSPEGIRDALANIQFNGTTGPIEFDKDGERSNAPMIMQVKNGDFEVIQD